MSIQRIISLLGVMLLPGLGGPVLAAETAEAIFAGGCFWCTEADFEKVKGVQSATSGYIGGQAKNPTYDQVSAGKTRHAEAVKVVYDPAVVTYEQLLNVYWHSIDPLVKDRQFCDVGSQYRTAIFYLDEQQEKLAEASKKALRESGELNGKIYTEIVAAGQFWPAEEYHQDYYKKNPLRYKFYRFNCGRDGRLEDIWGDKAGWKPRDRQGL